MAQFLQQLRPTITLMLKAKTLDGLLAEIDETLRFGTDCFGFQIDMLESEYRTKENYKRIFSKMQGKPAYVTNYQKGSPDKSDEELAKELLDAFFAGATLLDIRGGMFDSDSPEFSENHDSVKKQIQFIKKAHGFGAQVLMSTHIFDRFVPKDEVMHIMLSQESRGADAAKLVTTANSREELEENFEITSILKKEMKIPFLFLCNGTHCREHRLFNPMLGSCTYLAQLKPTIENQPVIDDVKTVMELCGYDDLPWVK